MAARSGAILIVEDFADDATALQSVLRRADITNPIEIVHSVPEAITYLTYLTPSPASAESPPLAVIFLDLKLPGRDGFALLDWLKTREEFNRVLVVVVSGLDDLASIRRAYALGADSFLTKPFSRIDLDNLIQWFPDFWDRATYTHPTDAKTSAH